MWARRGPQGRRRAGWRPRVRPPVVHVWGDLGTVAGGVGSCAGVATRGRETTAHLFQIQDS